jgi:hypothetical protein
MKKCRLLFRKFGFSSIHFYTDSGVPTSLKKTRPLKKTLLQCFLSHKSSRSIPSISWGREKGNPVQKKGQFRGQASGERQNTTKVTKQNKKMFCFCEKLAELSVPL